MTWPGSGTRSNSHSVAARGSCTKIPLAAGEGSGGRDHSSSRLFKPSPLSVRPPGSAGTDQAPVDRERGQRLDQVGLRTAPSIRTPAVAYFQSATSSLRARATIIVLPRRPPVRLIRSRNHTASADCGWCRSHSRQSGSWSFAAGDVRPWRRLDPDGPIRFATAWGPVRHRRQPAFGC